MAHSLTSRIGPVKISKFKCTFNLVYNNDKVNLKSSKVSCTPKKPKMKKPFSVSFQSNGYRFSGSIKINPTKIVKMSVSPPKTTTPATTTEAPSREEVAETFRKEYEKISTDKKFEYADKGCGLETKEFENLQTRGYTLSTVNRWTNGEISWSFVSNGDNYKQFGFMTDPKIGLSESDVKIVIKAMKQIEEKTCIKFTREDPQNGKDWLAITRESTSGTNECQAEYIANTYGGKDVNGLGNVFFGNFAGCFGGAYAYLGARTGSNQLFVISQVSLTDRQGHIGLVAHELLHNLGIGHTQKRPDQKENIVVLWNNIQDSSSAKYQYTMCEGDRCQTYGVPYDCNSIMHYEDWGFSKNGQPTMRRCVIGSDAGCTLGEDKECDLKSSKDTLRDTDITLLNKMYCDQRTDTNVVKSKNFPTNYENNMNVETPIDVGTGNIVEITFTDMNIEEHATCNYDYVKILDADGTVLLKESCGTTIPPKIRSKWPQVKVIFKSDNTVTQSGFRLEWKSIPTVVPVDGNWSQWSSWSKCSNNRDTKGTCNKKRVRYCNNPAASNGGAACQGDDEEKSACSTFDLRNPLEHPDCVIEGGWSEWSDLSTCNDQCKATRTRTCTAPAPLNYKECEGSSTDEESCTGGDCPSNENGVIVSPKYPENYPNDHDENYVVEVAEGFRVELTFTVFELEAHATCAYDYVEVKDTDGSSMVKRCGENQPIVIVSSGNKLTVVFHSDYSVNKRGFRAEWKKVDSALEGPIKSPGYPANYQNNLDETYNLNVGIGIITLTFIDFVIEDDSTCRWDYVEVFDSDGTTSIFKGCGKTIPPPVSSTGPTMTVKFHTDGTVMWKGFSAIWKQVVE